MAQVALAWLWAKEVASPIVGGTKKKNYDDAVDALDIRLEQEEVEYLEEPYLPHKIIGAIGANPPEGTVLLDVKK